MIEVYDPKSRQSHIYNGDSHNRFEEESEDEDNDDADETDDEDDDFDVKTFKSRNVKETSKRRNMRKISTSEDRRRGGKGGGRKRGRTLKRNETVNNFPRLATETEEEVASGVAVMGKSVTGPEPQSSFTPRTPNRSDHVTTNMEETLFKAGFFLSPTAKTGDDDSFDSSENYEMRKKFLEFFSNRKSIEGTTGDGGGKGMVEEKGDLRGKEREVVGTVNAREMKVRMEEDDGRHREDYDTSETRAPQDNATEKVDGHQQRLERTMESILEEMRLLRLREEDNRRRYNYANLNFNNNNNNNPLQYSKRIHERLRRAVAEKCDGGMVDANDKAGREDKSGKIVDFEFEEKTHYGGETPKTKSKEDSGAEEDSTTMPERPLSPAI